MTTLDNARTNTGSAPESFLVLHGLGNHRPPQHWQFLLAAALVERGFDVCYPELPNPDEPHLAEWLRAVERELVALTGTRVTVICHSLSCLLWFHFAASVLADPVDRVLLVSPPASGQLPPEGDSFRVENLNVPAVRASAATELAIICSDADPYNLIGAPTLYAHPLGITATVIEGAGHIVPTAGYGPWPLVLDWCLNERR